MAGLLAKTVGYTTSLLLHGGSVAAQPGILHIKQPRLPEYRFEWHMVKRNVYVIDVAMGERTGRVAGNAIAFGVENEGAAYNAVLIWVRGYFAGRDAVSHNDSGKLVLLGGE